MSEAETTNTNPTPSDAATPTLSREQILRKVTLFDYALHILSPFTFMTLSIIAVIINYVKRPDSVDTVYHGHMNWMIRTFWWTLFWVVVTAIIGFITFGVFSFLSVIPVIWYLYRNIKGLLRALDGQPIG